MAKMVDKFFNKILGSNTDRYLKKIAPVVAEINAIEPQMKSLSDEQLRARTDAFKERIQTALDGIEDKTERRKREQCASAPQSHHHRTLVSCLRGSPQKSGATSGDRTRQEQEICGE